MPRNFNLIFPHNLSNWKKVVNYINELLKVYHITVKTITDVINVLQELRSLFDNSQNHLYQDDIFVGLGFFLANLKINELDIIINKSIRNILYYCKLVGQLSMNFENEFCMKDNVTKVSLLSAKSILACSILCLMPYQKMDTGNSSSNSRISLNFQQIFVGIIHGSTDHRKLLTSILLYYVDDPIKSLEHETHSYITITVANCDPSPFTTPIPLHSWPIVIQSRSTITHTPLPNSLNLWPMFFQRLSPSNLFSSENLASELPIYSTLPVLIPLLPLLTLSVSENIGAINVKWEKFSGSIQKVHFMSPWDKDRQYSKESIVENIAHCLLAIKSSQKDCQQCDINFANTFTQSIIEDVILKLNSKSTYNDPLSQSRSSLTSNVLRGSREGSLCSNPGTRLARHSYSNSSSSRSGSLQLSSFSSRRSSSNTSSSQIKESEFGNVAGDYPGHNFQPVIVEECGNQADDEDGQVSTSKSCDDRKVVTLDPFLMTVSLSKNVTHLITQESTIKRYDSCPHLTQLFRDDDSDDSQMIFEEKQLSNRCCEEDANNDHLIRLSNRGRRQSLPCHLLWLCPTPLTDVAKNNRVMSRSSCLGDSQIPAVVTTDSSLDDFLDGRIMIDSRDMLSKLVNFADKLIIGISLTGESNPEQRSLCAELLARRVQFETECHGDGRDLSETPDEYCDDHSLVSRDLATFDRVLYSSTFFDTEAHHFFSKLSTMSSPNSVWMHHDEICSVSNDTVIAQVNHDHVCPVHHKRRSDAGTIVEYVNQLTTSIISDAIDHNYGINHGISVCRPLSSSCGQYVYNYAERTSVQIISTSLMQLTNKNGKKPFDVTHRSLVYVRPFPLGYDRQLSVLIQLLAGAISQLQTGCCHVMVFDQVTVEMEEILLLLATEKRKCSPEKVLKAIMAIIKDSGTISISNLISYLMHNY